MEDFEIVPAYDVFTKNLNLGDPYSRESVLCAYLYDKDGKCVGCLGDLHYIYDLEKCNFLVEDRY